MIKIRTMTTARSTLRHYFASGAKVIDILVGTVSTENNQPIMNWCPVQDWEGII